MCSQHTFCSIDEDAVNIIILISDPANEQEKTRVLTRKCIFYRIECTNTLIYYSF